VVNIDTIFGPEKFLQSCWVCV